MRSCRGIHNRTRMEYHAQVYKHSDLHHVLSQTTACRPRAALGIAKVNAQHGRRRARMLRRRCGVHMRQALRQVAPVQ